MLAKLLDNDELHMPNEVDLYHAIIEWGQRRIERETAAGHPARPLKDVVGKLLKRVRLGLIQVMFKFLSETLSAVHICGHLLVFQVKDLNSIVRKDGLVDQNDLMDALLYHTDNLALDLSDSKFHPRVG